MRIETLAAVRRRLQVSLAELTWTEAGHCRLRRTAPVETQWLLVAEWP